MILNQDNEYSAVLDACVLVPMPLCDTLLRLAEEPMLYRPIWSNEILQEVDKALSKFDIPEDKRKRRLDFMRAAFPEASVTIPGSLVNSLTCIPDEKDRHVVAAAIRGHAHVIVTQNIKDFPEAALQEYDLLRHTPDDFLVHQFHLNPGRVLETLDSQAANIRTERVQVLEYLKPIVPNFAALISSLE
jgi:predicted nucleic acid-binding protein